MKFWLTLVLGTILISGGMTYLVMHQGAQTLPDPSAAAATAPSEAAFSVGQLEGNVLAVNGGTSHVGAQSIVTVPIQCVGKEPLRFDLIRLSCPCVDDLRIGGKKVSVDESAVIAPGQTAELRLTWTPKADQAGNPAYRFSAVFLINDPQYVPTFRLEITTNVQNRQAS